MSEQTLEHRKKRLRYQSWYRGCKETDRIIGGFAKMHLDEMDAAQLDAFETILEEHDRDLFNWLTEKEPLPERYAGCDVMQQLMAFDVPAYLAQAASGDISE